MCLQEALPQAASRLTELSAPLLPCLLPEVFKGAEVQGVPCGAQIHLVLPGRPEVVSQGPWPLR